MSHELQVFQVKYVAKKPQFMSRNEVVRETQFKRVNLLTCSQVQLQLDNLS